MPIHVLDPISEKALAFLRARHEVVGPGGGSWREAEAIIVRTSPVPREEILAAPRLKVIGKHGVGVDNIDLAAAREKGVVVVNTPGANADAVAELSLGLALAAARHVVAADRALRQGLPPRVPTGRELAGTRLGIVGFGQVGRRVADLFARALRCEVTAYDPVLPPEAIRAAGAVPAASLASLLAASEIVSLHLPLTAATRHLIGAAELAAMRPDAILINTARGGIVDEAALAAALAAGRPGAAASDVFVEEPPPADHPLLRLPNFIATPHIGAATKEALDRVGLLVAEQVVDVLEGRAPRHVVAG